MIYCIHPTMNFYCMGQIPSMQSVRKELRAQFHSSFLTHPIALYIVYQEDWPCIYFYFHIHLFTMNIYIVWITTTEIFTLTHCLPSLHTANTIESAAVIRLRIQQTGANWQLESCCFTSKLSWDLSQVGSSLLKSEPDHCRTFNCGCSEPLAQLGGLSSDWLNN